MRIVWLLLAFTGLSSRVVAQPEEAPAGTLVLSDVIGLELSKAQIFAAAQEAWTFTFGQEPGAHVDRLDKDMGVIDGSARFNYRNATLAVREQTLGVITYRVTIECLNGQCRLRVWQFVHTGNRSASEGPVDLGPLYAGDRPAVRVPGVGLGVAQQLHANMRSQVSDRVGQVMNAFAARLRAATSP